MYYFPFHPGDYLRHTAHLSNEEDLTYRRLLDMYYDTEQPIPLETQSVSRRLRVGFQSVENVLNEFFERTEKGWINRRCEMEIREYHLMCNRNRSNGKLGGRPKKTQSVATGNPDITQTKPNQEPITKNQEPIKPSSATGVAVLYTKAFLTFWGMYPNRKNKGAAFKAFKKLKPEEYPLIKAGLESAKKSSAWQKDNGQFVPHPATWLNARGWEDEDVPSVTGEFNLDSFMRKVGS